MPPQLELCAQLSTQAAEDEHEERVRKGALQQQSSKMDALSDGSRATVATEGH